MQMQLPAELTPEQDQELEEAKKVELKKLSPRHKHVAALVAQGVDRQTIAAAVGYVPEYITWLQGQPLFVEYIREMNKAVATQLEAMFGQTVDVIQDAMVNGSVEDKLKGAKLQLEATGRIGRFATQAPEAGGEDRLSQLSERLLGLLERQRSKVNENAEDATIVSEQVRLPQPQAGAQ